MLTENQRENVLAKMMEASDDAAMQAVDAEVCRTFPTIEIGELVALWREAAHRQLDEAEALRLAGQWFDK